MTEQEKEGEADFTEGERWCDAGGRCCASMRSEASAPRQSVAVVPVLAVVPDLALHPMSERGERQPPESECASTWSSESASRP